MREHIRILGILNIIMGGFVALLGVIVLLVMGSIAGLITANATTYEDRTVGAPVVAAIGLGVAIFLLVLAAPSIIGGWGLLKFKPWSRLLMIIVSIFHLFHIPLGTALGVYGLWVLFSDQARYILESGGRMYVPPMTYPAAPGTPQQPTYPPPGV